MASEYKTQLIHPLTIVQVC